jgi:hypothetical protein
LYDRAEPGLEASCRRVRADTHPSGHSCGSGAIVASLQNFFGTDKIAFTAFGAGSGTWRNYTRFSETFKEIRRPPRSA